jgi:hypothetical protein
LRFFFIWLRLSSSAVIFERLKMQMKVAVQQHSVSRFIALGEWEERVVNSQSLFINQSGGDWRLLRRLRQSRRRDRKSGSLSRRSVNQPSFARELLKPPSLLVKLIQLWGQS